MNILKNVVLVLCICSLCSKGVMHTYRHFEPAVSGADLTFATPQAERP